PVTLLLLYASIFFFHTPATPEPYTLSLHDALPISTGARGQSCRLERDLALLPDAAGRRLRAGACADREATAARDDCRVRRARSRSEEHTSELQSRFDLVCRLLLEKKKNIRKNRQQY